MKTITIVAFLMTIITIPFIIKRKKTKLIPIYNDENKRYDINEYIDEIGLL